MSKLCIIPCGAKKIWDIQPGAGATEAKSIYVGGFHNACQRYARTFFDNWVILSAKHGFLLPDDIVPCNYDVAFNHKSPEVRRIEELREQLKAKGLEQYRDVVVLGGKKYVKVVEKVYDSSYRLSYPLKDCKGIGYMLQRLNGAVNQNNKSSK